MTHDPVLLGMHGGVATDAPRGQAPHRAFSAEAARPKGRPFAPVAPTGRLYYGSLHYGSLHYGSLHYGPLASAARRHLVR